MRLHRARPHSEGEHTSRATRQWVTPQDGPTAVLRHTWSLLREEGLSGLAGGLYRFGLELRRHVIQNETYCLYEFVVDEAARQAPVVPPQDVVVHVIETREHVRKLVAEGYEDVMSTATQFQRRLDSGAVAVCAFVRKGFASIDWMAFSEIAKLSFDQHPYKVDFEKGEACTGGAFTVRRFRRRGIATYRFSREVQYMQERGCTIYRTAIREDNTPSKRGVERFGGQVRQQGHFRRFLWWTSWGEAIL